MPDHDPDSLKTVEDALRTPAPRTVDEMMLERVITIASASAESSTRAAAALASVRSEVEAMRIEMGGNHAATRSKISDLESRMGQMVTSVNAMRDQRQEELDDRRQERESKAAEQSDRLAVLRTSLQAIFTPQTVFILLTIIGAAMGVSFNQPAPQVQYIEVPPESSMETQPSFPRSHGGSDMFTTEPIP